MKNKKYIVSNSQINPLLTIWDSSKDLKIKRRMEDLIVSKLSFLVQSRIKKYKKKNYYGDMLQEGRIGILKAIRKFDKKRSDNFINFALYYIRLQLRIFFSEKKYTYTNANNKNIINYTINKFEEEEYENNEVFNKCDNFLSVKKAINLLTNGDSRKILTLHFGFDGVPKTFEQISKILGVTKQRIQQIQIGVLEKLKNNSELKQLYKGVK